MLNSQENENTLWNNPMVNSAMKAMSPEELQRYKAIGEAMYGNIDFEGSKVLNNLPPPMEEAVAYISESLKSGLHPSMLDDNEVALLKDVFGDQWYKKWDYIEEDLKEIVTLRKK
jgi:hypothetical protein